MTVTFSAVFLFPRTERSSVAEKNVVLPIYEAESFCNLRFREGRVGSMVSTKVCSTAFLKLVVKNEIGRFSPELGPN